MNSFRKGPLETLVFCLAIFFFLHGPTYGQSIEDRLERQMKEFDAVGMAVAVVKDNEIIYENSFGWKDKKNKIPLEVDDLFRIASISKSFSAIAIMQLVEQGKLSLGDRVSDLIGFPVVNPNFPEEPITLEMLLTHTSSLTDSQRYGSLDIINPKTNDEWAKSYADYPPGGQYQYCNLGYNTIGAIIERVSGQRFDQYIQEHILEPLDLYGGYLPSVLDTSRLAQIYRYDREEGVYYKSPAYRNLQSGLEDYKMGYSAATLSPTGGMKISARDLAKYMLMLINNGSLDEVRIMTPKSAKEMRKPKALIDQNTYYGFALRSYNGTMIPGVDLIGHTGSAYGLNSGMMFNPEEKFGLIFISNGFVPADPDFRSHVMSTLYDYFIEPRSKDPVEWVEVAVDKFSLTLGGQEKEEGPGNFVDVKEGMVYNLEEATAVQSVIDLLYTYGETTGANLMVPASNGVQYFGNQYKEEVYKSWADKNLGKLFVLKGTDRAREFLEIENSLQLRKEYDEGLKELKNQENMKRWIRGPNARVHGLESGDVIYLSIPSREFGILSLIDSKYTEILAIGHIKRLKEGAKGEIEIEFKVASQ